MTISTALWLGLCLLARGQGRPSAPPAAAPTPAEATLTMPASGGRLSTGLYVQRGESVSVAADGAWTMWAGHFGRSNALGHRYRVGLHGWGQLMARVGDGPEIAVGTAKTFTSATAGPLFLFPNTGDAGMPAPEGELRVTIRGGQPVDQVVAALAADGVQVEATASGGVAPVYVEAGREVRLDAFGEWTMYEGGEPVSADGDPRRRLPDGTRWGRLSVRVGGPSFGVGPWQAVGSQGVYRPVRSGLLELAPAVGHFAGHTRAGTLTVVVRGGQPATDERRRAAETAAQDYERESGCVRLAQYRKLLGVPEPVCSPPLMKAAQAHAEYLAARSQRGHLEDPPTLGYTGRAPLDRATAMGFKGQMVTEAVHGLTDALVAVDSLWNTLGQRPALADPGALSVGVGVARGKTAAFVLLVGVAADQTAKPGPRSAAAVYPADAQRGLPLAWSGLEEPPVLPADLPRPLGPPVSLSTNLEDAAFDDPRLLDRLEQRVPTTLVGPVTTPGGTTLLLVPLAPLRPNETYRARVSLRAGETRRVVEWRFTTGATDLPPLPAPHLGDPTNPPVRLDRAAPLRLPAP